jgi:Acetyltransferase (GNAT) domain
LSKDKVKKTCRTMLRLGDVRFRHLDTAPEIREHMQRFADQHITRCVLDGRQSQFLRADYSSFYWHLAEELDPSRELRFSVLELSGEPVAYHLGFEVGGRYLFYKPTFDVNLWDYSPGQVLLFKLFEWLREAEVSEFDLGQGGEPYKYRYANACRENVTFTVHAPGLAGRVARAFGDTVTSARCRARQAFDRHPRLKAAGIRIGSASAAWRRRGLVERRAPSRVYALPRAAGPAAEPMLRQVTLRDLAQRAARQDGPLTSAHLQSVREWLKKGSVLYADGDCRYLVHASRTAVVETAAGPVELGGVGLVFTILRDAGNDRAALLHSLATIAAGQSQTGWLAVARPESGFQLTAVSGQAGASA